ncbi:helix-turn-helix transcriptional regulator [Fundicoccus sp. Sow4_H7]|uniref:helix-turn-helix transcriptional regulator n=1 Tax=Fundicoccus sp. Sow4_H7 TaxID=3438784 RepID=UPI003F8E0727
MKLLNDKWIIEPDFSELGMKHRKLSEEYLFFKAVAEGNLSVVNENLRENQFAEARGFGKLSKNNTVNVKYHFVIAIAMITRYCSKAGMEIERAFRLSDYYIQKLDNLHTVQEVHQLHEEMVLDFTNKMRLIKSSNTVSKHITECNNYIYGHIQERILVEDIAIELNVSASYLSRLFKAEMGISISKYINHQKIKLSMNLLRFSDESILDIANKFSFSSQSHFIKQFKEFVGMTPKKYRDKYYMTIEQ